MDIFFKCTTKKHKKMLLHTKRMKQFFILKPATPGKITGTYMIK